MAPKLRGDRGRRPARIRDAIRHIPILLSVAPSAHTGGDLGLLVCCWAIVSTASRPPNFPKNVATGQRSPRLARESAPASESRRREGANGNRPNGGGFAGRRLNGCKQSSGPANGGPLQRYGHLTPRCLVGAEHSRRTDEAGAKSRDSATEASRRDAVASEACYAAGWSRIRRMAVWGISLPRRSCLGRYAAVSRARRGVLYRRKQSVQHAHPVKGTTAEG